MLKSQLSQIQKENDILKYKWIIPLHSLTDAIWYDINAVSGCTEYGHILFLLNTDTSVEPAIVIPLNLI